MGDAAGPVRKRKRGIQQRLEHDYEARAQESKTHALLMSYLAEGLLSAMMVSSLAQAAMEDVTRAAEGSHFPDLQKTASCKHGKNLSGAVTNLLKKASPLPQPMQVNMPYKSVFCHFVDVAPRVVRLHVFFALDLGQMRLQFSG